MIRMAPLEDGRLLAFGRRRRWYMHRGKKVRCHGDFAGDRLPIVAHWDSL